PGPRHQGAAHRRRLGVPENPRILHRQLDLHDRRESGRRHPHRRGRPSMSTRPFGIEGIADDDLHYAGIRYGEVRDAVFANPYPRPYEIFPVTLGSLLRGVLPFGKPWQFLAAARRTVRSDADL